MTILLDTSALLAHHRDEEGAARVQSYFENGDMRLLIASVTFAEFGRRMLELGASQEEIQIVVDGYRRLFDGIISIDEHVAMKAFALAVQSPKRIPLIDSLIAAAACLQEATLVHRDSHFESIPRSILKSESL
jgi:predicted nucleic acid-binding protein